jgi:hypothetical protein
MGLPSNSPYLGEAAARMRRAPAAVLLALLLTVAAGLTPAVLPGAPLPAALGPVVALAADDISISTATRYTVVPKRERVQVVVDVTAVNVKPDRTTAGGVTRYFYDGVNLALQPEARTVRATQDGRPVKVELARRNGYRLVTILFRENLYYGQTARVRLTFNLPGGEPRSASDIRVGSAFTTFMPWAFGDRAAVRIEVPDGFRVEIAGADMDQEPGAKGLQVWSATTTRPLDWYALVTATNDDALTRDRVALAGGDEVVIRGWPEDKRWRGRVRDVLRDGVPALVKLIGLAWPVDGSLVVTEVHTPLLEGYAGFYNPETDVITISEDLDDLTIVHEASHAWFNKSLFTERWITEGLADEYAARVLRELDRGYPAPPASDTGDTAAFPLSDWAPPAAIRDQESGDRESYGYAASWSLMREIVELVGEDGMRAAFGAAAAGTVAYPGEAPPERSRMPSDWRRFLDLVQGGDDAAARAGVVDMVAEVALDDGARTLLPARAAARRAYVDLVEAGGAWAAPVVVRLAMDGWDFDDASEAMDRSVDVLAVRDEIAGLAGAEGLEPPVGPEADYQDAGSVAELAVAKEGADRSLAVLEQVAGAADAVEAPRDWFTDVGLDGVDPASDVAEARDAWEGADLEAAEDAAASAIARLAAAPEAGRTKVLTIGFGVALALVILVALALLLVRRRRGAGRLARATTLAIAGAGTPLEAAGPYATLPPEGPPAEPPGRSPSGHEGADPS